MSLIEYPAKHSEAEIQALLWYFLRRRKMDARLQVTGYNEKKGKRCCKMDIVIFVDKTARLAIECKSWTDNYSRTARYRRLNNTKQLTKYRELYKIPVIVCGRMRDISETIEVVKAHLRPFYTACR